jgi:hypothetical protein
MPMDKKINYIVSGLERSGTSLLMQLLVAGGAPAAYDHDSRPPDVNNPKGYWELEGGKIINSLKDGDFPMGDFTGQVVKITAYGLKFLPEGNYKIIYSLRNIEEILDSMEKMARIQDENREETKVVFTKLNDMIKSSISGRADCNVLFVNYNDLLSDPEAGVRAICDFVPEAELDEAKMLEAIDPALYRNRR